MPPQAMKSFIFTFWVTLLSPLFLHGQEVEKPPLRSPQFFAKEVAELGRNVKITIDEEKRIATWSIAHLLQWGDHPQLSPTAVFCEHGVVDRYWGNLSKPLKTSLKFIENATTSPT